MKGRTIYIIRHGKIISDEHVRRYIGHIDIPLSDEGVIQAQVIGQALSKKNITSIFCSDLLRSVATARIISLSTNVKPLVRTDIREISMGEWEGKSFQEIAENYPEEYAKRGKNIADYRVPGGESFSEGQARVVSAFADMLAVTTGDIMIVGHAGINRLLLCSVLGMPVSNIFHIGQDYGCINMLAQSGDHYCVEVLNASVDYQHRIL
ncbi:histidine phosphatase family protein [Sporomusa sp.]|uniref:histidine phosphatase family protein n=1 Tax=Sporomusa sp. TaxID=2078658 RepID=UPI002C106396|nr:histidine phosphatase family protein [Sporomusa sp.]HWR09034.1 histidine phosphatase family protein [Sporomusa sp.]